MGVASSIKTNFNKITCFISHLTKYIRVKESKTLKIKITLKKSKKKKKRNRANPLRLIKILYQLASRKCFQYSHLHFSRTECRDTYYRFLISFRDYHVAVVFSNTRRCCSVNDHGIFLIKF